MAESECSKSTAMVIQQIVRLHLLFLSFLSFCLLSCSNHINSNTHGLLYSAVDSNWYGTLPCADCPGISYELRLRKTKQFQLKTEYLERGDSNTLFGGWTLSSDSIIHLLNEEGKRIDGFLWTKDSLFYLDQEDERIRGSLARNYSLLKYKQERTHSVASSNTSALDADFVAYGNEPYWNLKIIIGESVRLEQRGLDAVNTPCPFSMPLEDGAGFKYDIQTEANHLIIEARREKCNDSMSDDAFGYSIHISLDGKELNGCGYFVSNPELNGTWQLESLNGEEINLKEAGSMLELTLHPQVCEIRGTDGCNSFFGNAEIQRDTLYIGNSLGSTLMACDFAPWQDSYREALKGESFAIELSPSRLRLFNDQSELIYVK